MELILGLIVGALAATRFATLVVVDDFGPIADLRTAIRIRYPAEDDAYFESEVDGSDDVGWTSNRGVPLFRGDDLYPGIPAWYPLEPHPLGTLLSCVRCFSVWTGLAVAVLILLGPAWLYYPILLPFAFSQVAISLTRSD